MTDRTNNRLFQLMHVVGSQIQARMCQIEDVAEKFTIGQVRALDILYRHKHLTMADLAKSLSITPASATSLVDRLVLSGWVRRVGDPDDRRKVQIMITTEKREFWESLERKRLDRLSAFLRVLTDEQKNDLTHILESLAGQSSGRSE